MTIEGRLIDASTGDQFVFSNIEPASMSRLELYRGYRWLVDQLYDFANYRERTLAFLTSRGSQVHGGRNIRRGDGRRFVRVMRDTLFSGDAGRARFTLSLLFATLLRRPSRFKEAVSFAIVHRAFDKYIEGLSCQLDRIIEELEANPSSI